MAAQPTVRDDQTTDGPGGPRSRSAATSSPARDAVRHPVVVGVDGSSRNAPAVLWAAQEAAALGVPLVLVAAIGEVEHEEVPGGGPLSAAARSTLERAARVAARQHPGLAIRTEVRSGRPREALATCGPGLVVVGRRGAGGFARLPLGSTPTWLAGTADNVVAVIPDGPGPDRAEGFGTETSRGLLVAVDALAPDEGVLVFAFEWAQQRALPLRVVTAWEVPPVAAHGRAGIRQAWQRQEEQVALALREVLAPWLREYPDVAVEREVVHGHPAGTVLELQTGEELTVLGRGGPRHEGFRMGPITRSVLQLGTGPAAVVP